MREKRRGRSVEEEEERRSPIARTHSHREVHKERQRISRGRAMHKEQSADYSERCKPKRQRKKNGGSDLFNDRRRAELRRG